MMNSEAVRILADMSPVTIDTIAERDIDVALLCYEPAINDLRVRVMLIDACDDIRAGATRTDGAFGRAVRVINTMISER